jgi:hypothetical protein
MEPAHTPLRGHAFRPSFPSCNHGVSRFVEVIRRRTLLNAACSRALPPSTTIFASPPCPLPPILRRWPVLSPSPPIVPKPLPPPRLVVLGTSCIHFIYSPFLTNRFPPPSLLYKVARTVVFTSYLPPGPSSPWSTLPSLEQPLSCSLLRLQEPSCSPPTAPTRSQARSA